MDLFITGNNISIGENTIINRRCYLDGRGKNLIIGKNVSISPEVKFITLDHIVNSPTFDAIAKETVVEDFVWIGTSAIILPGIKIGKGAVVGAGAIVTKDVKPFEVVAGNPAKVIKTRDCDPAYNLNYKPFFDTDIDLIH